MKREAKTGGQESLRILLSGGADLMDALLGRAEGGSTHEATLESELRARHPALRELTLITEPGLPARDLAAAVERGDALLLKEPWDLIVLSGHADIADAATFDRESYHDSMARVITAVKGRVNAHIIVVNAATANPAERVHTLFSRAEDPFVLRAHKLNLELIELSYADGISIVDVDRVIAELGAEANVHDRLTYSPQGLLAIREEFVRVMEDIGFFERRPMLLQVGNRER